MSLYIPNVKLPKDDFPAFPLCLYITKDGTVTDAWGCPIMDEKAIEVPPHGRLIDADAFIDDCPELMAYEMLMPTIIPADKEET